MMLWLTSWIAGRWLPIAILLAAAGAITAGYVWAYGNGRDAERARWEAATRDAGERFAEALAEQQATIVSLDEKLSTSQKRANKSREKYADSVAADPVSRNWDSQPIPGRVRDALGDPSVPADPG